MSRKLYVVAQGVSIRGVYTRRERLFAELPADVTLTPCPNPAGGWNGTGDYRGLAIRIVEPDKLRWPRGSDVVEGSGRAVKPRRLRSIVSLSFSPDEWDKLWPRADAAGMTLTAYLKSLVLSEESPFEGGGSGV